jgi:hypothetical protein
MTAMRVFSHIRNLPLCCSWLAVASLTWLALWGGTVAAATRQSPPASDSATLAITAYTALDTGWQFPLVNVRQPVIYRLSIEYEAQVLVAPAGITPEALRRSLVRTTALLPELFDIVETARHTETLPHERLRDTVEFTLRFSKPGIYTIPSLPVTYHLESAQRTAYTLSSAPVQGHLLTVDTHLPAGTGALPGDILAPPPLLPYSWHWLHYGAYGLLTGGGITLAMCLLLRVPQLRWTRQRKRLSNRQLRHKYQTELHHIQQQIPTLAGTLSPEARTWLRDNAALIRRLLGEWATGDPLAFAGGVGMSAAMLMAHLQPLTAEQETLLQTDLQLIEASAVLATAPNAELTVEDYQRCSDAAQHIITQLTGSEVSRVLRLPTRL